jgi:hypothetical protein
VRALAISSCFMPLLALAAHAVDRDRVSGVIDTTAEPGDRSA